MLTLSERFEAAQTLLGDGRREEAETLLDEILTAMPDHCGALNARGAIHLSQGDLETGEKLVRQAAALEPDNPAVLGNLSGIAQMRGDLEQALRYAEQAFEVADDPAFHAGRLGSICTALGRLDESGRLLLEALNARPDDPDILAALGENELARSDLSKALASFERALECNGGHTEALIGMAHLQCLLDAPETAIDHAKKAYLAAPRNPAAALALATALHHAGRLQAAAEQTERLLTLNADFDPARQLLTRIRIDQGDGDRALAELAGLVRSKSTNKGLLPLLAEAMATAGAWRNLLALIQTAPQSSASGLFRSLGINASLALGHFDQAWSQILAAPGVIEPAVGADSVRACRIEPTSDAMEALVLARAVSEWSEDAPVHFTCPDILTRVFERMAEGRQIRIETETGPLPPDETPVLSTLAAFLWRGRGAPQFRPYLSARPEGVERWTEALAEFPKPWTGVFWDARLPGLPIDLLRQAFDGKAGTAVSLQFDNARHQLRAWPEAIDAGVAIADPADLVDLIACLDRVIGPNGWPTHIAGALGRPGTVLLPANHDWYWSGEGDTSFWYPTVTRIVKPAGPDWSEAVKELSRSWPTE